MNDKKMCFFDKNHQKYILFYRESRNEKSINYNNFHAFHIIEDNMKIPKNTQKQISEIIIK